MKKIFISLFLPAMLALALVSCSNDSDSDASDSINKEGVWMLTHFHSKAIDKATNKVYWEREEYYDTNVSPENDYDSDCLIFDVKAPNEKGLNPADVYSAYTFVEGKIMWEKKNHKTFFSEKRIISTGESWEYDIISVTSNTMKLFDTHEQFNNDGSISRFEERATLTRISSIPGEIIAEQ